jgi:hypothetical protein
MHRLINRVYTTKIIDMDIYYEITEIKKMLQEILDQLQKLNKGGKAPQTFDLQDLEKILHVSRRTVATWMVEGILPHLKIGHKIYITQAGLDDFLARYSTKSQ